MFLITNTNSWEGGVTEAPWIMRNGSYVYLFYSGSVYNQPTYAIGVARAQNISSGFTKYASNPVLHSAAGAGKPGSKLHFGPGHCSVVAVPPTGAPRAWAFVCVRARVVVARAC